MGQTIWFQLEIRKLSFNDHQIPLLSRALDTMYMYLLLTSGYNIKNNESKTDRGVLSVTDRAWFLVKRIYFDFHNMYHIFQHANV